MRVPFQSAQLETFSFHVDGVAHTLVGTKQLVKRTIPDANIWESVIELPDGSKVWLTVVGDEDETYSATGITRGWYVVTRVSEDIASDLIRALSPLAV